CWRRRVADDPRGTAVSSMPARAAQDAGALREVACLFVRLGITAFGGPAAHIAMMEDEVVRRRRWLTREEFLDILGAANLLPGAHREEEAPEFDVLSIQPG